MTSRCAQHEIIAGLRAAESRHEVLFSLGWTRSENSRMHIHGATALPKTLEVPRWFSENAYRGPGGLGLNDAEPGLPSGGGVR